MLVSIFGSLDLGMYQFSKVREASRIVTHVFRSVATGTFPLLPRISVSNYMAVGDGYPRFMCLGMCDSNVFKVKLDLGCL